MMNTSSLAHKRAKGFTLIELIIVITIIVILGIVVVVLIDPAEMLAQGRDSQRISDLAMVKGAIQLVLATGVPSNASSVCSTAGAPSAGNADTLIWVSSVTAGASTYNKVTATSTRPLVDSTGWIKIDFTTPSTGAALSKLPVDPTNVYGTAGLYYRWGCNFPSGGRYEYEIDATLESAKYRPGCTVANCDDKGINDGGNSSAATALGGRYEVGNNLKVLPTAALGS